MYTHISKQDMEIEVFCPMDKKTDEIGTRLVQCLHMLVTKTRIRMYDNYIQLRSIDHQG